MGPIGPQMRERNREVIAERLHWPEGALEATRQLEAEYRGYTVWWGTGRASNPKPGFYANRYSDYGRKPTLYGETATGLQAQLAADSTRPA